MSEIKSLPYFMLNYPPFFVHPSHFHKIGKGHTSIHLVYYNHCPGGIFLDQRKTAAVASPCPENTTLLIEQGKKQTAVVYQQ